MIVVGLTGTSGSGKTFLSQVFEQQGFSVLNADQVYHHIIQKGFPCYEALVSTFGTEILTEQQEIDRKILSHIVFSREEKLQILNQITHPFILEELSRRISTMDGNILLDAPTLFESGGNTLCHFTIGVVAEKNVKLNRIIQRDGISLEQAEKRIDAQKNDAYFQRCCDMIFENNGKKDLEHQVVRFIKIVERRSRQ